MINDRDKHCEYMHSGEGGYHSPAINTFRDAMASVSITKKWNLKYIFIQTMCTFLLNFAYGKCQVVTESFPKNM